MLRRSLALVDRLALRRVVRALPPSVGAGVTLVGEAARGGALWVASAAVLCLLGRPGRRGAVAGLIACASASVLANGPLKRVVRRPRPGGAALIGLRRRGGSPRTSSFPSSHTASAFAFAVAASMELPAAAPVLVPAAAAVALARVRAVRHHPSDVLAGAVFGAVCGVAAICGLRRWRSRRRPA